MGDHPTADRSARHLEFQDGYMLFDGRQKRWACSAERNATQFCKSFLAKTLTIEILIPCYKDSVGLERSHTNNRIGRIVGNLVA